MSRVGIILAGGTGSRLAPMTSVINKHLLPVYDKPMIFYPIATLMLAGIRDIVIIHNDEDGDLFKKLLGNGEALGVRFTYRVQDKPIGIPDALNISADIIGDQKIALILGDNIFVGNRLQEVLRTASTSNENLVFLSRVPDPENFGIATLDDEDNIVELVEKPTEPIGNLAISGLYFLNNEVMSLRADLTYSKRNELEITELLSILHQQNSLNFERLGRAIYWLDAGTSVSLHNAATLIKCLQENNLAVIGSPEEIAFNQGWISKDELKTHLQLLKDCLYARILSQLVN